ncbi:exonuclease domain-containing protein [Hahella aquimaris]|uniref:exonuclease domain-containing protein n=1 Tax=Hahella sp. HNIBRBA332 TaxID=3015983 RepID=UPI00273BB61B|nr:exonuclease domain-containing protein [Hahella sp. HNIBRBA332]WLQ14823.1 exonuclease domain-containing protein [Hahella sp. HNIBRBA332]
MTLDQLTDFFSMDADVKALARWSPPPPGQALENIRWVAADVETTGLNTKKDVVIAIGAVEIDGLSICLEQTFELVIDAGARLHNDNILIHGLSQQTLSQGVQPKEAIHSFLSYAHGAALLAFHAPFDKAMLEKEARTHLGVSCRLPFYDLAEWLQALCPEAPSHLRSLDDWSHYFGLYNDQRHHAACDAMAAAELALICLQKARSQGVTTWKGLQDKVAARIKLEKMRAH